MNKNFKFLSLRLWLITFSILTSLQSYGADEALLINVGKAGSKQSLIAMPDIKTAGSNKSFLFVKNQIQGTIQKDLNFTNYFRFVPASSYKEDIKKVSYLPKSMNPRNGFEFSKWNELSTEFIVQGLVKKIGATTTARLYLYYVPQEKLLFEKEYTSKSDNGIGIAHEFANDVMKKLTGKASIFTTKILMTSDRVTKGTKEVHTINWDGSGIEKISKHRSISLSPTWSPGGNQIAYSAFTIDPRKKTRNANLYIYDFRNKKLNLISSRNGINSGADFFPDGKSLMMTLSATGTPDIYKVGLNGQTQGRITSGPFGAMNVEPSISPDGKSMVFSSDRSGRPMIYVMGLSPATPAKRITIAGRYNAAPVWSPDGKKIAFAGWDKDHFDIFTMNADGTNMQRLTQRKKSNGKWSSNEYPTFSPDGRYIAFQSNRTGNIQIYITNLTGSFVVPVTKDKNNYFQPKWSPYLN